MTKKYEADICLVLEGTYPFVSGGVSSWVHMIIQGMEEFTFTLLVILPKKEKRPMKFDVPSNVVKIREVYLQDDSYIKKKLWKRVFSVVQFKKLWKLHKNMPFANPYLDSYKTGKTEFEEVTKAIHKHPWNISSLLYSKKSWKLLLKLYHFHQPKESFLDYMWTWRFLHIGIFAVMKTDIPDCRMYHTVSTGYAGLLAARARILKNRPMVITEHGIYSKERKIEISRSDWLYEESKKRFRAEKSLSPVKQIWINAFRTMSRFAYDQASEIFTLYNGNLRLQIEDGADASKLNVIPNGVDYKRFSALERQPQKNKIVGFVGRVVSIKDVKTFIRSIRLLANRMENVEAWIMGPTEEEEGYYEECVQLVKNLNLEAIVTFTGSINLVEYYPKIDVLVLTSLSEGQPLVILEAHCLSIPVVASDVGACKDLLQGQEKEDKELGVSGLITGLSNPKETADSIYTILHDPELYKKMGEAGKKRMELFYDIPLLFNAYRKIYKKYTEWQELDLTSKNS
ncbi:MAG: glycosyltransferase involved in cell wall biosynthesis [bacterium]|jgi:glycosyltransferase involved in cell wall biosynthesis